MQLPKSKPRYEWYSWHKPRASERPVVTFIGLTTEDTFALSEEAMHKDLQRSGLNAEYMRTTPNALSSPPGDSEVGRVSYTIPYFGLDGELMLDNNGFPIMYRRRRFVPETADLRERKKKYTQPSTASIGDIANIPYLHPDVWKLDSKRLVITEGEKKAAAIMAHLKIPAIGIGGCWNWQAPHSDRRIHTWIQAVLDRRKPELVIIIPDGDYHRYQIKQAYGGLISQLREQELNIEVRVPPRDQKIDDLIASWESPDEFEGMQPLPMVGGRPDSVEPQAVLINRFALITRITGRGDAQRQVVVPNASNITTLVTQHEAFSTQFWYDLDHGVMMNGEQQYRDSDSNEVLCYVQYNLSIPDARRSDVEHAIRQSVAHDQRSPLNDWLRGLKWDRKPRLETWLMDYCGAPDTPLVREASLKFLVGAVRRRLEPGSLMDWMLIVNGPQGIGKSSLPRILFGGDEVVPMMHADEGKDFKSLFHRGWCISFEELEAMNKRDVEGLKAIVSSPSDTFRPPYERTERTFKRRCVLYGSTNSTQFLAHDPTGYRRYVVVPVEQVLFKRLEEDRVQLWAEAVWRYGQDSVDPSQVLEVKNANMEQYAIHNELLESLEERLRDSVHLKSSTHHGADVWVFKLGDILSFCGLSSAQVQSPAVTKPVANQLAAWGWRKLDADKAGVKRPYIIAKDKWHVGEPTKKY